ncbi:MAG: alpha-glucosidase, partial [Lachnospiraceae bacterium]|nr:alpha-glucosidase [Lachnospiraceae bacterium]
MNKTVHIPDLRHFTMTAAKGKASFPMTKGSFKYRDRVHSRTVLTAENHELKDSSGAVLGSYDAQEGRLSFHMTDPSWNRFYITFEADPSEHYYGCGETFSEWDLKGQQVRIWVAEHQNAARIEKKLAAWEKNGPRPQHKRAFSQYESYYAQPTFVSSNKWFMHVDGSSFMRFDFTKPGQITLELRQEAEITTAAASSFAELSEKLSAQLGRVPALPDWIYDGMILGIQQGPDVINEKLVKCEQFGIPVNGIWSQDWCGCRRTGFGYQVMWNWRADDELYPDLKEQIRKWNQKGIRFLGYINPFMAIEKELYREASARGYCVKNKAGEDCLVTITTFPAAMIDLTNPEAYAWYKELIKQNMIGIGMSGWMADFGEYLPTDAVLYDGSDPELIHNQWPAIWAKLNREAVEECGKLGEVFFFTRAGFTQTIRYSTMMWNGDQHVDWSIDDGIGSVIPAALSLAMSGYGVSHSDVGGYTTMQQMTREKELLMRWEEMNVFSPLMRSHEGNQPSRSVQFDADEELLAHLGRCVRMHKALGPYLKELMQEEVQQGIPVMRPLFYHYDEAPAYTEAEEYLLGRDILAAPVIQQGKKEWTVWLPEDTWVHLFTGEEYTGGRVCVPAPLGEPPVFIR